LSGEEIDDILIYNVRMDKMITMIELFIEGEISGKISLVFKEKENEYEFPQILTGNFTRKFLHDWYSSQCIIKLIPENESVSGIIKIKTRIFN
jgi:hypothetical protein